MRVNVGSKVTTPMPDGRLHPAIAISPETAETVTVVNKSTGLPVDITVTRADFVSLRESLAGEKYLAVTNEVVQYGYRMVALPRFTSIVGLDADADGAVLSLADLMEAHAESFSKWQASNFEARRGAVSAADL